jgi:hypothetical protein
MSLLSKDKRHPLVLEGAFKQISLISEEKRRRRRS